MNESISELGQMSEKGGRGVEIEERWQGKKGRFFYVSG